ncbi:MAG: hypothetical protein ACPG4T_19630 [Nannocystaceae bacterium]
MICADVIEVRFTGGAFALGKRLYRVQLNSRLPDEGHIVRKILSPGQALVVDGQVIAHRCSRQRMPIVDIAAEDVETVDMAEEVETVDTVDTAADIEAEEVETVAAVDIEAPPPRPKQRQPRRTRAPSPPAAPIVRQFVTADPKQQPGFISEALNDLIKHQVELSKAQLTDMREHCAEVSRSLMEASKRDLARYEHERALAELEEEKRRFAAHMHGGPGVGIGPALQQVVLTLDKIVNGGPS